MVAPTKHSDDSAHAVKKRKLEISNGVNGHAPLQKQESFTAVLEQLEAEEDASGGT